MARLIYLMGPSGAGKDSLLAALRADADSAPLVAHRYITRPADAGCENHIALSEPEFLRRRAKGLFALDWQAHQQHYAFGIEVDLWLLQGSTWRSTVRAPTCRRRSSAMVRSCCRCVCRSAPRSCAGACRIAGEKAPNRSSSGWRGRQNISRVCPPAAGCCTTMAHSTTPAALLALLPTATRQAQDATP